MPVLWLLTFSSMAYGPPMAMLAAMLEDDRRRAGWSMGEVAWRLGVSIPECRELEAGDRTPTFETWNRICRLYGWPADVRGGSVAAVAQGRKLMLPSD